jgi:hypothetical protein
VHAGTVLKFLEECYDVEKHRVAFSCNCFLNNGLALEEIEGWWLERLDLPRACLRRATVNTPSSAGRAGKRTLLYGTARLAVHSTQIAQSIYGAIQEYAGIERPDWLDCAPRVSLSRVEGATANGPRRLALNGPPGTRTQT